jgi:hypothetical protein
VPSIMPSLILVAFKESIFLVSLFITYSLSAYNVSFK